MNPVTSHIGSVGCFGGGTISIDQSEGGLPILKIYDKTLCPITSVEIKDTVQVEIMVDLLKRFYRRGDA